MKTFYKTAFLCSAALALNIAAFLLVTYLRLPVFMDTIFTVALVFYAGLVPALIVAALYNPIMTILLCDLWNGNFLFRFFVCNLRNPDSHFDLDFQPKQKRILFQSYRYGFIPFDYRVRFRFFNQFFRKRAEHVYSSAFRKLVAVFRNRRFLHRIPKFKIRNISFISFAAYSDHRAGQADFHFFRLRNI